MLIYVEEYLLLAYCFPLDIETDFEYPHVTLLVKDKISPKKSNQVLETILGNIGAEQKELRDFRDKIKKYQRKGVLDNENEMLIKT